MEAVLTKDQALEFQALDFGGLDSLKEVKTEAQIKREEWLKSKLGIISASSVHKLCGTKTKDIWNTKEGWDYISELVHERLFKVSLDKFVTQAMINGTEREPLVVRAVEKEFNIDFDYTLDNQKFIVKNGIGATPDGLSKQFNLETKCPEFLSHCRYKRMQKGSDLETVEPKYWYQVQTQMLVTGKNKTIFASYFLNENTGYADLFTIIVDACPITQEFIQTRCKLANEIIEKELKTFSYSEQKTQQKLKPSLL